MNNDLITAIIARTLTHYNVSLDPKKKEDVIIQTIKTPLVNGKAHLVVVDIPYSKLKVLENHMMSVVSRLQDQEEYGATHNSPFHGIKCYHNEENPISRDGEGPHGYMVRPTTEKLKRIGFNFTLLNTLTMPSVKTATTTFKPMKMPTINFKDTSTFPTMADAVKQTTKPASQVHKAAAAEPPRVTTLVESAEPLTTSVKPSKHEELCPPVAVLFKQTTVPTVKCIQVNTINIHGFIIQSDGLITDLEGDGLFSIEGATFLLVNKKRVQLENKGDYSVYSVFSN